MELERKLSISTVFCSISIMAAGLVVVGSVVSGFEEKRLAAELRAAHVEFTANEADRLRGLEWQLRLVAESPQLKAVVGSKEPPVIVNTLETFRANLHVDFLDAYDEQDRPVGHRGKSGLEALAKITRESGRSQRGFVFDGESLKQAITLHLRSADRGTMVLAAGYRVTEETLARVLATTRTEVALFSEDWKLVQSTSGANELLSAGGALAAQIEQLKALGREPEARSGYVAYLHDFSGAGGERLGHWVWLRPMSPVDRLINRLRWVLVGICFVCGGVSGAFAWFTGRSISTSLRRLSARLATAYPDNIHELQKIAEEALARGGDPDVRALLVSFAQLLTQIEQDRARLLQGGSRKIEGLEAELAEARASNVKLAELNRRLVEIVNSRRGAA